MAGGPRGRRRADSLPPRRHGPRPSADHARAGHRPRWGRHKRANGAREPRPALQPRRRGAAGRPRYQRGGHGHAPQLPQRRRAPCRLHGALLALHWTMRP